MGVVKRQAVKTHYPEMKQKQINRLLGKNMQILRNNAGYSQPDVFRLTGIPKSRLSEIENGHTEMDLFTFLLLLDTYGQSADYALGRSCEPINDILASHINNIQLNAYKFLQPLIEAATEQTVSFMKSIDKDEHLVLLKLCDNIAPMLVTKGVELHEDFQEVYALLMDMAKVRKNISIKEAQKESLLLAQLDDINQRRDKEDGHRLLDDLKVKHQYTLPLPKPENVVIEVECE